MNDQFRKRAVAVVLILSMMSLPACVSKSKYLIEVDGRQALTRTLEQERQANAAAVKELNDKLSTRDQQIGQLEPEMNRLKQQLSLSEAERAARELEAQERLQANEQLIGTLKGEVDKGNIKISQLREKLTVQIVDKVLFSSGSDEITEKGKEVLSTVSDSLKTLKNNLISVEGHTDNVPVGKKIAERFPSNWELSTARATQVVRYLGSIGIDQVRMQASGFAEYRPIVPNDTPENRQQNRRIEIVLTPDRSAAAPAGGP